MNVIYQNLLNLLNPVDSGSHRRCSIKLGPAKILKNSQENTCVRASFLIKLQVWGLQLYYERDSDTGIFQWILRNFLITPFYRTPPCDCFCLLPKYVMRAIIVHLLIFFRQKFRRLRSEKLLSKFTYKILKKMM